MTSKVCMLCVFGTDRVITVIFVDQVLLFFKFYDPMRHIIMYMGHSVEPIAKKFGTSSSPPGSHFVFLPRPTVFVLCT